MESENKKLTSIIKYITFFIFFIFLELTCRNRWKTLAQRMRKELRLVPKPRSGDAPSDYTSKWKWFQSMLFISSQIEEKEPSGNLDQAIEEYDAIFAKMSEESEAIKKDAVEEQPSPSTSSILNILPNEKKEVSEDELHFRTLLRHVCKIKRKQILVFRNELLQLVLKFAYNIQHTSNSGK